MGRALSHRINNNAAGRVQAVVLLNNAKGYKASASAYQFQRRVYLAGRLAQPVGQAEQFFLV